MPTILIVDDMAEFRHNMAQILQFEGLEVMQADNPVNGFAQMQQYRPDLILIDLSFPGFNGVNFIAWVRGSGSLADIPIIAVSGLNRTEDVEEAISAGANDYLVKPVAVTDLIECIKKHLIKI